MVPDISDHGNRKFRDFFDAGEERAFFDASEPTKRAIGEIFTA
jgi:hypothetical protein